MAPFALSLGVNLNSSRRVGTAFSPLSIPGSVLWLDATDEDTITKDGSDFVSNWADKSGAGNDMTQPTATNQPLFLSSGINGLPVIEFDGSNDFLNGTNAIANLPGTGSAFTLFFVARADSDLTVESELLLGWNFANGASNSLLVGYQSALAQRGELNYFQNTVRRMDPGVDYRGVPVSVIMTLNGAATEAKTYINGVLESTLFYFSNVLNSETFIIGGEFDSGLAFGNAFEGVGGEFGMYDNIISDPDIATLSNYLVNRWAT